MKKPNNIHIFLFILFTANYSVGYSFEFQRNKKSCSTITLPKKSTPINHFFSTPRNQTGVGWCYGYTAADLLSYKLQIPISANHTSAIYNKNIENNKLYATMWDIGALFNKSSHSFHNSGLIQNALKDVIEKGTICPESIAPSNNNQRASFIYFDELIRDRQKNINPSDCSNRINYSSDCNLARIQISPISFSRAIETNKNNPDSNLVYSDYLDNLCGKQMISIPKKIYIKTIFPDNLDTSDEGSFEKITTSKYLDNIDRQLKHNNILGFSYNIKNIMKDPKNTGSHASVIIGREWKNGKCYYKIRNSWGKTCTPYNSEIRTNCDITSGTFLITDKMLYNISTSATYISDKTIFTD